jgi:hypothetical protein
MWTVAVPRGLTHDLPLPQPDVVLESLAACTLADLRARLEVCEGAGDRSPRSNGGDEWPVAGVRPPTMRSQVAAAS